MSILEKLMILQELYESIQELPLFSLTFKPLILTMTKPIKMQLMILSCLKKLTSLSKKRLKKDEKLFYTKLKRINKRNKMSLKNQKLN